MCMKLNYSGNSNSPGIYKIVNTRTNRIYIGQAQSFKKRWAGHISSLRGNKHRNKFMQNDFNKCFSEIGDDNFLEFSVIEVMTGSTKEERNKREEQEILLYFHDKNKCYNHTEKVRDSQRSIFSSNPEETRKKYSINSKKLWENNEFRQKMMKRKGTWNHTQEAKTKISNASKVQKRSDKCKALAGARFKQYWQDPSFIEKMKKYNDIKAKPATFIDPQGNVVVIKSISAFCKENGYDHKSFYLLRDGKAKSAYGYTAQKMLLVPFLSVEGKIEALNQMVSIALSVDDQKLNEIIEGSKAILQSQSLPPATPIA